MVFGMNDMFNKFTNVVGSVSGEGDVKLLQRMSHEMNIFFLTYVTNTDHMLTYVTDTGHMLTYMTDTVHMLTYVTDTGHMLT
jgi:hypothetical protein